MHFTATLSFRSSIAYIKWFMSDFNEENSSVSWNLSTAFWAWAISYHCKQTVHSNKCRAERHYTLYNLHFPCEAYIAVCSSKQEWKMGDRSAGPAHVSSGQILLWRTACPGHPTGPWSPAGPDKSLESATDWGAWSGTSQTNLYQNRARSAPGRAAVRGEMEMSEGKHADNSGKGSAPLGCWQVSLQKRKKITANLVITTPN